MTSKLKLLGTSSVITAILAVSAPAYAAPGDNTNANTLITNNVNITYDVGGVAQTPPPTATNQFRVDRKILFTVTEKTAVGTTNVTSGQTGNLAVVA